MQNYSYFYLKQLISILTIVYIIKYYCMTLILKGSQFYLNTNIKRELSFVNQ